MNNGMSSIINLKRRFSPIHTKAHDMRRAMFKDLNIKITGILLKFSLRLHLVALMSLAQNHGNNILKSHTSHD